MSFAIRLALAALLSCSSAARAAGHAHEHGVARLDVAVEGKGLTLQLESPLDNLLGFERAPRTDAERRQAEALVGRLRASSMFAVDPAARCTPVRVELVSAALNLGHPDPHELEQGHADIDGTFEFDCVDASKASYIDVGLFDFARLQRLDVQVVTPRGQFKREVKRPERRIVFGK